MIKTCISCSNSFEGRSHAKTCSATCRKRLQRLNQAATRATKEIETAAENTVRKILVRVEDEARQIEGSAQKLVQDQAGFALATDQQAKTEEQGTGTSLESSTVPVTVVRDQSLHVAEPPAEPAAEEPATPVPAPVVSPGQPKPNTTGNFADIKPTTSTITPVPATNIGPITQETNPETPVTSQLPSPVESLIKPQAAESLDRLPAAETLESLDNPVVSNTTSSAIEVQTRQIAPNPNLVKRGLFGFNKAVLKIAAVSLLVTLLVGGNAIYIARRSQTNSAGVGSQAIPEQSVSTSKEQLGSLVGVQTSNASEQELVVQGDGVFTGNIYAANFPGDGGTDASKLSSGTIANSLLSDDVTLQGNEFNGANQLVQLDGSGFLPALNGSALTSLNASNISSGTLNDARLSSNVALLNRNDQIFTGANQIFRNSINSTSALSIQNANGTNLFVANTNSGEITLGSAGSQTGKLVFSNSVNSNNLTLQAGATSSNLVLTLPTADGTSGSCLTTNGSGALSFTACATGSGTAFVQGGNSFTQLAILGTNDSFGLAIETAGTERIRIDTAGNVGIGKTNPGQALDVVGSIQATVDVGNLGTNVGIRLEPGALGTQSTLRFDNDNFRIYAGGTGGAGEILRVTEGGNVGIGVTNPTYKLQVAGNTLFGSVPTDSLWTVAPMNIVNNGNFGEIKTQLNLINSAGGAGSGSAIDFYTYVDAGNSSPGTRIASTDDGNFSGNIQFYTKTPGNGGNNSLAERVRIESDGDVAIGTTSSGGARLRVVGERTTGAGNAFGTYSTINNTGSDNFSSGTLYGTNSSCSQSGGGLLGTCTGIDSSASASSQFAQVTNLIGGRFTSSGNATNAYGIQTQVSSAFDDGITNGYGLYIQSNRDNFGSITNNYGLYIQDQTASTSSTNNFNMYSAGANSKNFIEGRLGIGDTTPDNALEILSSSAANTQLTIGNTNAGDFDPRIGFELADGTNTFTMGVDDSDGDKFKISTTALGTSDRFVIDSSGNIGIGDSTPAALLTVGSGDVFQVNSSGNVTYVSGTTNTSTYVCRNASGQLAACSTTGSSGPAFIQGGNSFGTTAVLGTNDGANLEFETSGTTKLTLSTAGDLTFSQGANRNLNVAANTTANGAGYNLTVTAGGANGSTTGNAGGMLSLLGGNAAGTGNNAGGAVLIQGGTATGTGASGSVIIRSNVANSTTALQVQRANQTPVVTVDTTNSITTVRGLNSTATEGSELFSTFGTASGWINGCSNTCSSHTSGTTAIAASPAITAVSGTVYKVTYIMSFSDENGTITPSIGGRSGTARSADGTYTDYILANSSANLTFVPTNDIQALVSTVSVKAMTVSNSVLTVQNSDATTGLEIRAGGSGLNNAFIGTQAGANNVTGSNNLAVGTGALQGNVTGTDNLAVGYQSLQANNSGTRNVAIGYQALQSNTTGTTNSAIGYQALQFNTTGFYNNAIGESALQSNTSGFQNVAIGLRALMSNTTGNKNSAIGTYALRFNTTGTENIAIGDETMYYNVAGSLNTAIGSNALEGANGQSHNYSTAIGAYALNGGANYSTAVGVAAGINGGDYNVALGYNAVGYGSARTIGIGYQAAFQDPDVTGFNSLNSNGTVLSNSTAIGYGAQVQQNNSLVLGGQGVNQVNVGIGTTRPSNVLSVSPWQYFFGTASQSGTTVTGTGTTWTSAMVGSEIIFSDGKKATITVFNSATSLTVDTSQTAANQAYRIHYVGLQVTSAGRVGIGTASPSSSVRLHVVGGITSPGAGASSEIFGLNAASAGVNSVAFGNAASAGGPQSVVVGTGATTSSQNNVILGYLAAGTGNNAVAIGSSSSAGPESFALGTAASANVNYGIAIGGGATVTGDHGIAIGGTGTSAHNSSIVLGREADSTAANQFVVGGNGFAVTNGYFGNGVTNAAPSSFTLQGTGGSGSNIGGADLRLAGGAGTGSAEGGVILFQHSTAGSSGSSQNAQLNIGQVGNDGIKTLTRGTATAVTQYSSYDFNLQSSIWDTTNAQAELRQISIRNIGGSGADGSEAYRLAILNHASTEFVTFDALNQRVGIGGITTPGYALHVQKDAAGDWVSKFENTNAGGASVLLANGGGFGAYIDAGTDASASSYALNVNRAGSTYLYVQGDGKIGIGTSTLTEKLEVAGNIAPDTVAGGDLGTTSLEWDELYLGDDNGLKLGLDQDATLAYDEATDDRVELTGTGASLFIEDKLGLGRQTFTMATAGAASETVTPTTSYVEITGQDNAGDDVIISAASAKEGDTLFITNLDATAVDIDGDTATMKVSGGADVTLTQYDVMVLIFDGANWLQVAGVVDNS